MKINYIDARTKQFIRSENAPNLAEAMQKEVEILDVPYRVDGEIECTIPVTLIKENKNENKNI